MNHETDSDDLDVTLVPMPDPIQPDPVAYDRQPPVQTASQQDSLRFPANHPYRCTAAADKPYQPSMSTSGYEYGPNSFGTSAGTSSAMAAASTLPVTLSELHSRCTAATNAPYQRNQSQPAASNCCCGNTIPIGDVNDCSAPDDDDVFFSPESSSSDDCDGGYKLKKTPKVPPTFKKVEKPCPTAVFDLSSGGAGGGTDQIELLLAHIVEQLQSEVGANAGPCLGTGNVGAAPKITNLTKLDESGTGSAFSTTLRQEQLINRNKYSESPSQGNATAASGPYNVFIAPTMHCAPYCMVPVQGSPGMFQAIDMQRAAMDNPLTGAYQAMQGPQVAFPGMNHIMPDPAMAGRDMYQTVDYMAASTPGIHQPTNPFATDAAGIVGGGISPRMSVNQVQAFSGTTMTGSPLYSTVMINPMMASGNEVNMSPEEFNAYNAANNAQAFDGTPLGAFTEASVSLLCEEEDEECICNKQKRREEREGHKETAGSQCNCCHCRALRDQKLCGSLGADLLAAEGCGPNPQLKFFIDSIILDLSAMEHARRKKQYEQSVNPSRGSYCPRKSFPVTITEVTDLGSSSLFVKWCIHDCYGIGGYEIYVDGYLTNRYFQAKHEAAVVCNVDVTKSHKVVLMATPIQEEDGLPDICAPKKSPDPCQELLRKGDNPNRCPPEGKVSSLAALWVPSIYMYDPNCRPDTAPITEPAPEE